MLVLTELAKLDGNDIRALISWIKGICCKGLRDPEW